MREDRGEETALRGAALRGVESALFHVPCGEPSPSHRGIHHEMVKQPLAVDVREAGVDITFQQVGR